MNNYSKSLSEFLFYKIHQYQSDENVRRERPRLDQSGLYFDAETLSQWIHEHDTLHHN